MAIHYVMLWHWEYLDWSRGSLFLVLAIPVLLSLFAMTNNPVELTVVCLMMLVLSAVAMPVWRKVQTRKLEITELTHGREVVIALLSYAHEHQERFPEKLGDVTFDEIPEDSLRGSRVRCWRKGVNVQ